MTPRQETPVATTATAIPIAKDPAASNDVASVVYTDALGTPAWIVRPAPDCDEAIVTEFDLDRAESSAGDTTSAWESADVALKTFHLEELRTSAERLLREVFDDQAVLSVELQDDPYANSPAIVFGLAIPEALDDRRETFVHRYVRETKVPRGAPVPAILWDYLGADHT